MKCPHCGQFIENTLYKALEPYHNTSVRQQVVITNIDYVVEIGNRIRAVIEEKQSNYRVIRGYQLITLRKIAKSLKVPLYILFSKNNKIELYNFPTDEMVKTSPFVSFQDREPILSGSIQDLGAFFYEKYLIHAPPSQRKIKRRWYER
jgi:hypothetical protein